MHCSLILGAEISPKEIPGTLLIILHSKILTAIKTDILTYTHGQTSAHTCTHHTHQKRREKTLSLLTLKRTMSYCPWRYTISSWLLSSSSWSSHIIPVTSHRKDKNSGKTTPIHWQCLGSGPGECSQRLQFPTPTTPTSHLRLPCGTTMFPTPLHQKSALKFCPVTHFTHFTNSAAPCITLNTAAIHRQAGALAAFCSRHRSMKDSSC